MAELKDGTYFDTVTLLSNDPDKNKRIIRRYPGMEVVCILNPEMQAWTMDDQKRLQVILTALNEQG